MKIREHRGSLDDSLATAKEIEPTEDAVRAYLTERYSVGIIGEIVVKPYGYDPRISWDTHVVMLDGCVAGFTDGPLKGGCPGCGVMPDLPHLATCAPALIGKPYTPLKRS